MSNIELLDRLTNRMDNARHVVWAYRLSAEQGSSQNSSYALQLYRMQRIREMMNYFVEQESPQNDLKVRLLVHELERIASHQRPKDASYSSVDGRSPNWRAMPKRSYSVHSVFTCPFETRKMGIPRTASSCPTQAHP